MTGMAEFTEVWGCLTQFYGLRSYVAGIINAPRETCFFDLLVCNSTVYLPDNGLALFSFVWMDDLAKIIIKSTQNESVFNDAFNVSAEEVISC